jgi:hypothetical protein
VKQCTRCKTEKPVTEFKPRRGTRDGLQQWCQPCRLEWYRNYRANQSAEDKARDAERKRGYYLKGQFGITLDQYNEMLEAQGGVCAVPGCGATRESQRRRLSVDHDRSCCPGDKSCGRCVRAILCDPCNIALGMMRDSPDLLRALAVYVESFRDDRLPRSRP